MEKACERAERYLSSIKKTLETIRFKFETEDLLKENLKIHNLLDAAERYINDSEYYLDINDCETSLVAVSYAEGLLDSLKYLGLAEFSWPKPYTKKRVFVAGTFEIIHPGHLELLRYASSLGEVHVIVARDSTVMKVKGRKPIVPEKARLEVIKSLKYVKEAYLGHPSDPLESVKRIKPDIIVLGPDQPFEEKELAASIEKRYGFRPQVLRFPKKRRFCDDMASVRDIYKKVCKEFCPFANEDR